MRRLAVFVLALVLLASPLYARRITTITADGATSTVFQVTGNSKQYNAQVFGTWDGASVHIEYRCGMSFDAALPWHDMPNTSGPYTADAEEGRIGLGRCQVRLFVASAGGSTDLDFELTGGDAEYILVVTPL